MKKVEIYDEDNSIVIDDDFDTTDFTFYPENKKFKVSQSIKNDCFYNNQTIEYKISVNPIEIYMRTLESSSEPPLEYSIKDGVVLESEINKKDSIFPDRIENLKKEVEWSKINLFGNYEINLYLLSKHPEIISKEDYRRFLRQSVEKIKMGVLKVEEALKKDPHHLQLHTSEHGKWVWYPDDELESKERDDYYELPEEKRSETKYGKKLRYVEKFNESLFKEDSPKYVGVSDYEFKTSVEILEYIEKLLNQKDVTPIKKEEVALQQNNSTNRTIGIIINLLTVFFIILKLTDGVDWNWFAVLSPFLIWQALGFISGFLRAL